MDNSSIEKRFNSFDKAHLFEPFSAHYNALYRGVCLKTRI